MDSNTESILNEILEDENYIYKYLNKLESIFNKLESIFNNNKKEVKDSLKSCNTEKLKHIRNKLSLELFDEFNLNEGDIILKNRKGNKLAESYSEDIYNLSVFYLDRTFIDPLNELFTVGIKPQVLIKERQEKEKLTIRLKEKSDSNLVKRDKDMLTTETILKEILEKINNVDKKVDGVVVKQDLMQIQLDTNSENINKLNESIAISKLEKKENQ